MGINRCNHEKTPLLVSIKWEGNVDFEDFLRRFNSHIRQQNHLQCILESKFHSIYSSQKEPDVTLVLSNRMNIHCSLNYITVQQFITDIGYLYHALLVGLPTRGSDIVIQEEATKDGIVVYHTMVRRYRFGDL